MQKKKKKEDRVHVCACERESVGGGETASESYNWLYLSVELDTSLSGGADTHHTHTFTQIRCFYLHKKTTFIKFKNFSLSSLTVGPRRSHGSNRGSGGCDFGVHRMDNGGGCDSKPLLEDLHCWRKCHHHLYDLWKPVDVLRDRFNRGQ